MPDPSPSTPHPRQPSGWPHMHLWQIQPLRDGLVIAAVLGLVWLGYRLSVVTVPLLLALLLAYLFEPLVKALVRRGAFTRRGAALAIIVLAALALIGPVTIGGGFAVYQGVKLATRTVNKVDLVLQSVARPEDQELQASLPGAWRRIRDYIVENESLRRKLTPPPIRPDPPGVSPPAEPAPGAEPVEAGPQANAAGISDEYSIVQLVLESVRQNASAISRRLVAAGTGIVGGALAFAFSLGKLAFSAFLTAFFFYFFCTGWGKVLEFWEGLIPERRKLRVVDMVRQMDRVIAGFVRGRLTVAAIQMVIYTLAYWIIGVPAPLIVGPLMGVLTIMPYASTVAAPIAMLLMWLDPAAGWRGEWWWVIGGPLVVLAISQAIEDWILTPLIQGKTTNMDVPTILFASIAGGALAGVYGVLVAIPVAACVKILLREVFWPRFREWSHGKAPDLLPIRKD